MDPLSFPFLAYAAFCLARATVGPRPVSRTTLAVLAGGLMMLLDIVIDPVAARGDRWFLGPVFFYAEPGWYFGIPVTNFLGWWLIGACAVAAYGWSGGREPGSARRWPAPGARGIVAAGTARPDRTEGGPFKERPGSLWPGVALYYGVLAFNLAVTAWIAEWLLLAVGTTVQAVSALVLWWYRHGTGGPASLGEVR